MNEKVVAYATTNAMKIKSKLGMGLKKKKKLGMGIKKPEIILSKLKSGLEIDWKQFS